MATMSRQHYEHLAATLGRAVAVEACEGGGEGSRSASAAYRVALAVADSLADTSPRYDECRFLDAVDKHAATAGARDSAYTMQRRNGGRVAARLAESTSRQSPREGVGYGVGRENPAR
jgi:hypothetical protein